LPSPSSQLSTLVTSTLCLLSLQWLIPEPCGATIKKTAKPFTYEIGDSISPNSKVTYFELLRKIFPDITQDGTATKSIPISQLIADYEDEALEGNLEISFDKAISFDHGKTKRLFLAMSVRNSKQAIWGENFLLTCFDIKKSIKLLDAVDVQCDRSCSLVIPQPALSNNSAIPMFVTVNTHANSAENYEIFTILTLIDNKISIVGNSLPLAYSCKNCDKGITEAPYLIPIRTPSGTPSRFVYRIELTERILDSDCEIVKRESVKSYNQAFRWQSNKYVPISDKPMQRLHGEEKRLGFKVER
jgi:hypothetical protein